MIEIFQVDAFTDQPFSGNPAGVCILDKEMDEQTMRNIAMEMAVSETAFISLPSMDLRWFTPKVEVELCGHATLATAAVLHYKKIIKENRSINFNTMSGILPVKVGHDGIEMIFPITPVEETANDKTKLNYLGIAEQDVVFYGKAGERDFVQVKNENVLRDLMPDFRGLLGLPGRGVIVTSSASLTEYDFISRYFAPWVGVNEDPVTGAAHCALASYWEAKLKKKDMVAYQASKRGGVVYLKTMDGRVNLSGKATIILEGRLRIHAYGNSGLDRRLTDTFG